MRYIPITGLLFIAMFVSTGVEAQFYYPQKSRGHAVQTYQQQSTYYDPQPSGQVVYYDAGQLYNGLEVGSKAPEVSMPNAEGRLVSLSSLRGKYVLLHFWASWCPNSQTQVPNYSILYNKYKKARFVDGAGFEPYSISLDTEEYYWKKYTEKFNMTWGANVCDYQEYYTPALLAYGVNVIPTSFLIDPNGFVVAKGLDLPSLDQLLASKAVEMVSQGVHPSDERPISTTVAAGTAKPAGFTYQDPALYGSALPSAGTTYTVTTQSVAMLPASTSQGTGYSGYETPVADSFGSTTAYYNAGGYAGGSYKIHLGEFASIPNNYAYDLRHLGKTEALRTSNGTYKVLVGTFGGDIRRVLEDVRSKGYTNAYVLQLN